MNAVRTLSSWSRRRWLSAAAASAATVLVVAIPTDLIPNPVFGREVGVTWWSWPVLVVTAALSGLLFATYVREPGADAAAPAAVDRRGMAGGLLAYLAVGCPVCNKLVLLALGYSRSLQWFAPVQPYLAVGAVVLLGWALRARLSGAIACPVP